MSNIGVIAINTGFVQVKKPFLTRKGGPIGSRLRILLSAEFSSDLPVLAWLISHPEGDILIDAGMSAGWLRPDYLDSIGSFDAWLTRRLCRFQVEPGQSIGAQLPKFRAAGTQGLRVFMTHLHIDHVDGLRELQGCEIWVNESEWAHPSGAPKALLAPLTPRRFAFEPVADPVFDRIYPITRAGDLFVAPTPGHTPNHCSIILRRGGLSYVFTGDAIYNQKQLLTGELAGAHANARLAARSIERLEAYAKTHPTVVLPSHDPDAVRRLAEGEIAPLWAG
ncbi:N-acyl homoserine lactonase family protein [Methylocapsa acidiphila]|uniref:N-acyl homoserine lactonase family protein n=1 Tax=Methylocapsa acidiphila TaxID=133552 RepID=UPI00041AEFF1|nr:N-acyl homoserine lactonase family protein [Methylocapsa acidiphila]